jgi:hypothetical protein
MPESTDPTDWLTDARSMVAESFNAETVEQADRDALQSIAYSLIGLLEVAILAREDEGPPF